MIVGFRLWSRDISHNIWTRQAEGRKSNLIFENVIFVRPVCGLLQFNCWSVQPGIVFVRNNHLHLKEREILRKLIHYPQYSTTGLHTRLLRRFVCCVKSRKTCFKCSLISVFCLKPLSWAVNSDVAVGVRRSGVITHDQVMVPTARGGWGGA